MDYLTKYYKNLSEQLQEQINILEAKIRSPQEIIAAAKGNPALEAGARKRAGERADLIDFLKGNISNRTDPQVDRATALRVLQDIVKDGQIDDVEDDLLNGIYGPTDRPSTTDDLKHIASTARRDFYTGSDKPEEIKLDDAREKTYQKINAGRKIR
jgi:hypothetical protein